MLSPCECRAAALQRGLLMGSGRPFSFKIPLKAPATQRKAGQKAAKSAATDSAPAEGAPAATVPADTMGERLRKRFSAFREQSEAANATRNARLCATPSADPIHSLGPSSP